MLSTRFYLFTTNVPGWGHNGEIIRKGEKHEGNRAIEAMKEQVSRKEEWSNVLRNGKTECSLTQQGRGHLKGKGKAKYRREPGKGLGGDERRVAPDIH